MSHLHYDKCPGDETQLYALYANAKMGKNTEIKSSREDPILIGEKKFKELTYTKNYTPWQRAGRFCEGLLLTICTGCLGLIDQRVRSKFTAAVEGRVDKKVIVANDIFENVISKVLNPESSNANTAYELAFQGQKLLEENNPEEAERVLKEATEKDPSNAFAFGLLGQAKASQKEYGEAKTAFETSIKLDPKNASAHIELGKLFHDENTDKAIKHLEEAAAVNPGYSNTRLMLAGLFNGQGKTDKAIAHVEEAITTNPDDLNARLMLAGLFNGQGKTDKALKELKKIFEMNPSGQQVRENIQNIVKVLEPDKKIEFWNSLIKLAPNSSFAHGGLGTALLQRAREKDFDNASIHLKKAIGFGSNDPSIYKTLAKLSKEQGKTSDAITYLNKAIELDPKELANYRDLAEIFDKQGNPNQALGQLKKAFEISPSDWLVRDRIEEIVNTLEFDKQIEFWNSLTELTPNNSFALAGLGAALFRADKKNPAEALKWLEEAYSKADPSDWSVHDKIKAIANDLEPDERIKFWQDLTARVPNNPFAHTQLGTLLLAQGKFDDAEKHLTEVIEIGAANLSAYAKSEGLYTTKEEADDALRQLEEVVNFNSRDMSVYVALAALHNKKEEPEKAINYLRIAFKSDPFNDHICKTLKESILKLPTEKQKPCWDRLFKSYESDPIARRQLEVLHRQVLFETKKPL